MAGLGRRIGGGMLLLVVLVLGLAPVAAGSDALPDGEATMADVVPIEDAGAAIGAADESAESVEAPAGEDAAGKDDDQSASEPPPVVDDEVEATSPGRVVVGGAAAEVPADGDADPLVSAPDEATTAEEAESTGTAGAPAGTHDDGSHDDGSHDDGSHDDGSHDDGSHDDGHGGQPVRLSCADIDPIWVEFELKGHPVSGTYAIGDDFRTVEVVVRDAPPGGKLVDWSADGPIDAVILRSGQDAATYEYEPPALGDTGLLPPLKDRDGRNLASVKVCYDPSDPLVGIDVVLVDSDDPVEVGDEFEYRLDLSTSAPLVEAEVVLTLPAEVELLDAAGCAVEEGLVRCAPPLDSESVWQTTISVVASSAGNAIARARLRATAGGEELVVSSVEVTRIIGRPGSGGGCGGHDDGGHDDGGHDDGGHDGDDECPGATRDLVAACEAIHPDAISLILAGPFSDRDYLLEGDDGVWVEVTVSEATGIQVASWVSNVPVDAVFSRTGRDVATFAYEPPAFAGNGIVGPPGGSGKARPMADVAVCYVARTAVDVALDAHGPDVMEVGETAMIEVTIANVGHSSAEGVSLGVDGGPHLTSMACGGGRCSMTDVAAGDLASFVFEIQAVEVGIAKVLLDVDAANESPGHEGDNAVTLTIVVEAADVDADTPPTEEPPVDTIVKASGEELPETGPVDMVWQLVAAIGLLGTGSALVRRSRAPRQGGVGPGPVLSPVPPRTEDRDGHARDGRCVPPPGCVDSCPSW